MSREAFANAYSAEVIESMPSGALPVKFELSGARRAHPLLVTITPLDDPSWIGAFARGYDEKSSETGLWLTPDDARIAVVAAGAGYYVDVRDPAEWEEVPIFPIRFVRSLVEEELLVFGDFSRLAAYGRKGLKWQTADLVWDDLAIVSTDESSIIASGYDAEHDRQAEVRIDLFSGKVSGAIGPR
jgi:hypothetical protein